MQDINVMRADLTDTLDARTRDHILQRALEDYSGWFVTQNTEFNTEEEAHREAIHAVVSIAAPRIVAAALIKLTDHYRQHLQLTAHQWEVLSELAHRMDLDTVEEVSGA